MNIKKETFAKKIAIALNTKTALIVRMVITFLIQVAANAKNFAFHALKMAALLVLWMPI